MGILYDVGAVIKAVKAVKAEEAQRRRLKRFVETSDFNYEALADLVLGVYHGGVEAHVTLKDGTRIDIVKPREGRLHNPLAEEFGA